MPNIYVIIAVVVIIGLFIAGSSYSRLVRIYERYNKRHAYVNITAAQFTAGAFAYLKLPDHRISITERRFGDAYVASRKVVILSKQNAHNKSVSAISVAAHEIGHVIQHEESYGLFAINYLFQIIGRVSNWLMLPSLTIGLWLYLFSAENLQAGINLLYLAGAFYIAGWILKIITIPLELNASKRAIKLLKEEHIFDKDELKQAKKVLRAAALTYVGGLFANLLRTLRAIDRSFK